MNQIAAENTLQPDAASSSRVTPHPHGQDRRRLRRLLMSRKLQPGCLVVHADHGVARFEGVDNIMVGEVSHACLQLVYAKGDKVFVPVENADLVTYYGPSNGEDSLDRLGGGAWEERKRAFQDQLLAMAQELVQTAAARELVGAAPILPTPEYRAFAEGFPHELTADQAQAIADVEADLASGKLMDRLVCGDVGFGKTEVAFRAAFLAAMAGRQVALIAPTTPLCRQHAEDLAQRVAGFGLAVVELSRNRSGTEAAAVKKALRRGEARIVVGTHALLGAGVKFKDLGLLIIDEEQRFGVRQKEQLKAAGRRVHVLTMTATPIPRTLQLATAGLRQVSLIATAPAERKPVETTVLAFDDITIRNALLRERKRGGQSFYVCPRLKDLPLAEERIRAMVPDVRLVVAHGRMKADALDAAMSGFVGKGGEVLLATNIIESGLNIPTANTMIVHRADMFGMAQLYQLRGRVGRSPEQGYVYLTHEPDKELTGEARERLDFLAGLQTLGSGFDLASRDLDIRGAGALFGEEQSGHLKDIGAEMFERMLSEAVDALRSGRPVEEAWAPRIQSNLTVLIPDDYVPDPQVRMQLYRHLADSESRAAREAVLRDMEKVYGPAPAPVRTLVGLSEIKAWCRRHHVETVDIGPKGVTMSFREGHWPDQERLEIFDERRDDIDYVTHEKLIYRVESTTAEEQLDAARTFMREVDEATGLSG